MHTFAERPKMTEPAAPGKSTIAGRAHFGHSPEMHSLHRLQRTTDNLAVPRQEHARSVKGDSTPGIAGLSHDFSRIPVNAVARSVSHGDIPVLGQSDEIIDQPAGDSTTSGAPTHGSSESCGQPRSMHKVTSGTFLGGLTMDSYYPDLAGGGTYDHPGTGGTFDTGSRAGANVQLYGVIPSPCLPSEFHLEQTVTRARFRVNGVVHPEEGRTFDDLAKSRRDTSRPPFRQEFLGGGTAPLGYIISMADPPSTGYSSTSDIEHDRDFVTSLVGPSGRESISWSLSTRISAGAVTRNVLT